MKPFTVFTLVRQHCLCRVSFWAAMDLRRGLLLAAVLFVPVFLIPVLLSAAAGIEPQTPAPSFDIRFEDVSEAAGIRFHHERAASVEKLYLETMGAGVGWIDYDGDGLLDAFFVNSGATPHFQPSTPPQPALYRNLGDGTFPFSPRPRPATDHRRPTRNLQARCSSGIPRWRGICRSSGRCPRRTERLSSREPSALGQSAFCV